MRKDILILSLMGAGIILAPCTLVSQNYTDEFLGQSQPSRYVLGNEENLLFPVNILGLVQKPGQYLVPYRTDLLTLIAYAGGFRDNAKISKIKIIRQVRQVASNGRDGGNGTNGHGPYKVYDVNMKKYIDTGDPRYMPQLTPDDTIIIEGSTIKTFNKVFDFVGKAIMLAQLYFLIRVANNR